MKVLVAEDDMASGKFLTKLLAKYGEVVLARDGIEAVDNFVKASTGGEKFDLVCLDIMMPKLDGWGVCKEIRKESKVPIIMLTARSDEEDELQGFKLGVDEYISKPFSPKILVARVEAILRRCKGISSDDVIECDGIVMNRLTHIVTIDGKEVDHSSAPIDVVRIRRFLDIIFTEIVALDLDIE